MKSYIIIRTVKEGFHQWNSAPIETKFLRYPHRHLFHIEVKLEVGDLDRELEFFAVKKVVDEWAQLFYSESSNLSCEMMCLNLNRYLKLKNYPVHSISIFEDNENGALIEF